MVSSLTTVRLFSQQAALNAFKEVSESRATSSTIQPSRTLADMLYAEDGSDDGHEDSDLSALIATLQRQAMGVTLPDPALDEGSVEDISSVAFMRALQSKLEQLKANPDSRAMAETMLKALEAGTLTVTDAVAGEQVAAFDISENKQPTSPKSEIRTADWSSFLKEHLTRDNSGRYLRNPDSSHQDKTTGASSYFGMIGDTYYYLSWTDPGKKPDVSIQI